MEEAVSVVLMVTVSFLEEVDLPIQCQMLKQTQEFGDALTMSWGYTKYLAVLALAQVHDNVLTIAVLVVQTINGKFT